jgi:chemosensory pili system protein ChpB (putative protein-glutamate methylesterase)
MPADTRPNIGIISDCPLQRHVLLKTLKTYGLNVELSLEPNKLDTQYNQDTIDCWILVITDEDFESEAIDQLIEQEKIPVLFGLEQAPNKYDEQYISWERRLLSKLEEHLGTVEILESENSLLALDIHSSEEHPALPLSDDQQTLQKPTPGDQERHIAEDIWVLAASLGGPAAVKAFLDKMPASINAGFLYAQHIDAHFSAVLTKVLGRHSKLELTPVSNGCQIYNGEVLVVPVDNEVTFSHQEMNITKKPWEGPYGPSIDHLLRNLFACYGSKCHVIVFSGMGNDGALIAPKMHHQGCSVWTQTPDSCANGSMPQSIIDLNCSEFSASPEELAEAFIKKVGCR